MFIGRTPSYLSEFGVKMYLMMDTMQAYVRSGENVPFAHDFDGRSRPEL